jgi:hypothetical protein
MATKKPTMTKKLKEAIALVSDSITRIDLLVGDRGKSKITTYVQGVIVDENTFSITDGQGRITLLVPEGTFEEYRDDSATGITVEGGAVYGKGFFSEQALPARYSLRRVA